MDQLIDSKSQGDPSRFHPLDLLERQLAKLTPPRDRGSVRLLVTRGSGGVRTLLDRASMTPASGMPGDAWGRGRRPSPDAQLTVMQIDVADLIANGQPLTLFGDNMFLDLDLSASNLPTGSQLRAGTVTFQVTPLPHNGCRKFRARFGDDALRFTLKRELRPLNLRGVYMRVVEAGEIALGDRVHVISRPLEALAG
jgi:MOSC domain-containing protein YiiM